MVCYKIQWYRKQLSVSFHLLVDSGVCRVPMGRSRSRSRCATEPVREAWDRLAAQGTITMLINRILEQRLKREGIFEHSRFQCFHILSRWLFFFDVSRNFKCLKKLFILLKRIMRFSKMKSWFIILNNHLWLLW